MVDSSPGQRGTPCPHPPLLSVQRAVNLLVRACNQLGQFLQHRETNLRYLALESMCTLASSEFPHVSGQDAHRHGHQRPEGKRLSPVSQGRVGATRLRILHAVPGWFCTLPRRGCAHVGTPSHWVWHVSRPAVRVEIGSSQRKKKSEIGESGLPGVC